MNFFEADITGEFPEKLYPLPLRVELKAGTDLRKSACRCGTGLCTTFRRQLQRLLQQNNPEMLLERIAKGSLYYATFMEENLKIIKTEAAYSARIKRRSELWELAQNAAKENPKLTTRLTGRKRKKGMPLQKGETYKITYSLIKEGKSIEEIASKRKLAASTIEGHVVRGIREGALDIFTVLQEERVKEVADLLQESSDTIGEIHSLQNGRYTHGELRMVQAHLEK